MIFAPPGGGRWQPPAIRVLSRTVSSPNTSFRVALATFVWHARQRGASAVRVPETASGASLVHVQARWPSAGLLLLLSSRAEDVWGTARSSVQPLLLHLVFVLSSDMPGTLGSSLSLRVLLVDVARSQLITVNRERHLHCPPGHLLCRVTFDVRAWEVMKEGEMRGLSTKV